MQQYAEVMKSYDRVIEFAIQYRKNVKWKRCCDDWKNIKNAMI